MFPIETIPSVPIIPLDVYHDESKEAGYWHGILFIPHSSRSELLRLLQEARENTGFNHPIALKGLDRTSGPRFRCIRAWLNIGVASLSQSLKSEAPEYYTGKGDMGRPEIARLKNIIGARFILFRLPGNHDELDGYPDYAAKVETTFRMGLKGGLHFFSDETKELLVKTLHFDGYEHYQRHLDKQRVISRLGEMKSGVRIAQDLTLHDESGDHSRQGSQPYDDCQLLQLADILVGGFRTILGRATHDAQTQVAHPLSELTNRWRKGPARMRSSRWYKGFALSQALIVEDEWKFESLPLPGQNNQLNLF